MAMTTDALFDFDLSSHGTTTTTTSNNTLENHDQNGCNWNEWSPIVDWAALSHDHHDYNYNNLIEAMDEQHENYIFQTVTNDMVMENCSNTASESESTDSDAMRVDEERIQIENLESLKGLRLVHLLMSAAEAVSGGNDSKELARVVLARLKELVTENDGTTMERLAAYFTEALQSLLEGHNSNNSKNLMANDHHHRSDVLAAFQLLQDMSPYIKFGHFTANQAILEAVAEEKRIHIIDYDIMEGIQWASLMQALVSSRKDGQQPAAHLRITALSRGNSGRRSIGTVQETGRRLAAFAESIGQPFSFHQCRLDPDEKFRPSGIKSVRGEAVVVNCMLHMPNFNYRTPNSVASFLSVAKTLNPRLVAVVEEEVGLGIDGGFVGRFMDTLHHYSAVFDSLEAGFPMQRRARGLVEKVFLGPRITGSVGRVYQTRGEEEIGSWWERIGDGWGLIPVNISFANHCQAKLLVGLFNDGYRVEELGGNRVVLGWKSRRLLSASIWTCP